MTHSCHVFVLVRMSYLHSILFPVTCVFAFYCFHLRSAKKSAESVDICATGTTYSLGI